MQLSLGVDDGFGHAMAHRSSRAGLQFFAENFEAESEGFGLRLHRDQLISYGYLRGKIHFELDLDSTRQ